MKILLLLVASILLPSHLSLASTSDQESNNLVLCAFQFELLDKDEFGEGSGILEESEESTYEGTIRVYKVVQDNEVRGYMSIDVQGDINQIDASGSLLKVCQ